jgi:hypothetical protein
MVPIKQTLGSVIFGGTMTRSLLIMMLAMTQLLAGSGGTSYLCINGDGFVCCIDSGLESCTCCHHENRCGDDHDDCCEEEHSTVSCCECSSPEHDQTCQRADGESVLAATDSCGCTHILISVTQPPSTKRSATTAESERLIDLTALPSMVAYGKRSIFLDVIRRRFGDPPLAQSQSLLILATVVIRC